MGAEPKPGDNTYDGPGAAGQDGNGGRATDVEGAPDADPVVPPKPETGAGITECRESDAVGPTPIRRLETFEYVSAVRDVFGVGVNEGSLPSDEKLGTFVANVTSPLVADHIDRYQVAARGVAGSVAQRFAELSGCAGAADAECVSKYLKGAARRLFHGTLEDADAARIDDLYSSLSAEADADVAVDTVVQFMLLSPRFLYLVEFGEPDSGPAPLTGSEVAGRLAAFLWRSVPDEGLLAAADAGELDTSEGVKAHARAMMAEPRAQSVMGNFAKQWLRIADPAADAAALEIEESEEVGRFMAKALTDKGITFKSLINGYPGPDTPELGSFYGDDSPRSSVLMTAGYLRTNSTGDFPSSVKRGYVIRSSLLCQPIGLPTNPTDMQLEVDTADLSPQEVFARHSADPMCWGCHVSMDPLGDAFGKYDNLGAYHPDGPGSTAGELSGLPDGTASFAGAEELVDLLATNASAQQCFLLQNVRHALGRGETAEDACSLQDILSGYQATEFSVQDLLVEIAGSQMFRTRNNVVAKGECR